MSTRAQLVAGSRFVVVGLLSLGVDMGSYIALHALAHVPVGLAAGGGFLCAFVVNFTLNRTWVFGGGAVHRRQLVRYTTLVAVNLPVTMVAVAGLVGLGLEYRLAKLVVAAGVAAVNYVVQRRWVFSPVAPARELPLSSVSGP